MITRRPGGHPDFCKPVVSWRVAHPNTRPSQTCIARPCTTPWYGWHGFRRGIASNLHELGANDKIVQRVLRHAKPHVTRERYIKAFDPAVMEAMQRMQVVVNSLQAWPAVGQQTN